MNGRLSVEKKTSILKKGKLWLKRRKRLSVTSIKTNNSTVERETWGKNGENHQSNESDNREKRKNNEKRRISV